MANRTVKIIEQWRVGSARRASCRRRSATGSARR